MDPEEFLRGGVASVAEPDRMSLGDFTGGKGFTVVKPDSSEEKLSFARRAGEDLKKGGSMAQEIKSAYQEGEQGFAESLFQLAGKVGVGSAFDLVGEGIVSAFRALPDVVEDPIRTASSAFLETDIAQAGLKQVEKGTEAYSAWKEQNPRAARNLESVVNIGLILSPVKKKPVAPKTRVGQAAETLGVRAEAQQVATRASFIDDLVRPAQTKAVREAQVGRTIEGGIIRTKRVQPTAAEKAIAAQVARIEGVSGAKTFQGNFNVIQAENIKLAKQLADDLKKNDFVYPKKEALAALDRAKASLAESPLIVGDAAKTAERLVAKFEDLIRQNKGTGSGLLKARKDFDSWVKTQKGTKAFDPKQENALSISLREIRNTANDFLERGAKDVAVKESLRRQSALYRAMDNIKPKAASEASNAIIRAWQNFTRILPLRGEFNQSLAVLFGLGGLGASAVFAPFFTKLVLGSLGIYGASRLVMGAGMKKALSQLLKGLDTAIKTTKDANLLRELRADRALILELLEAVDEAADEE